MFHGKKSRANKILESIAESVFSKKLKELFIFVEIILKDYQQLSLNNEYNKIRSEYIQLLREFNLENRV